MLLPMYGETKDFILLCFLYVIAPEDFFIKIPRISSKTSVVVRIMHIY